MRFIVLSTSLNPSSKSRELARVALADLLAAGQEAELVDLQAAPLPLCDGAGSYDAPGVAALTEKLRACDGILLASAVYNYDVNAAAKNLLELTGEGWEGKAVGFLLASGGMGSYMSVMGFANSLMLDFRCLILPRFVYALGEHFQDGKLKDEKVRERVRQLVGELGRVAKGLRA